MHPVTRHTQLAAALPYRLHPPSAPPQTLSALIDCGEQARHSLWQLDWAQLDARARGILESGEYLPALAFHWLERAAALLDFCTQEQCPAAILDIPKRRLTQLAISDLLAVMGSDLWLAEAQVALIWGFDAEALHHGWRQLLPCRGALYPCTDGLNSGSWAQADDLAKIAVFS